MKRKHWAAFSVAFLVIAALLSGCKKERPQQNQTKTTESTNVNVQSYLMDASAFGLDLVITKLKEGKLKNAEELEKFINEETGINNVDLDKDGNIDELTVKEEQKDGKNIMAVIAHPKTGEETVISELAFEKNTQTEEVTVTGAYPEYVNGYQDHYYRHTMTGSVVGDMMFYHWMFSPRPMFYHPYHYGMYYSSPRPIMGGTEFSQRRSSYRTTNNVSPVKKQTRPSNYKPQSKAAQKSASNFQKSSAAKRDAKLSSRSGQSKGFSNRGTSQKSKASGFGSKKSTPSRGSSWGSSRRSGGFRSSPSRGFSGGSRRSNADYKHNIHYLDDTELASYADQCFEMPLATWNYNDFMADDGRSHLGIITQDVGSGVAVTNDLDSVDLYGYTSIAIAAIQVQQKEIEELKREVKLVRQECAD